MWMCFFQSLGFGRLGLVNKVREIPVQNLEKKVSQRQTPFHSLKLTAQGTSP